VSRNRSARAPGLRPSAVPATSRTAPAPYQPWRTSSSRLGARAGCYTSHYETLDIPKRDGYHPERGRSPDRSVVLGARRAARRHRRRGPTRAGPHLPPPRRRRPAPPAGGLLPEPRPLPTPVIEAGDQAARALTLPEDWLTAAPAALLDFGLPGGFVDRLERRDYG